MAQATRFFVGTIVGGQTVCCPGCTRHQRLSGYSSLHRKQWTKVAEAYPRQVNSVLSLLAYHLANHILPIQARRRLDLAACARCHGARIGEAQHPGPRSDLLVGSLEDVSLVTPTTAKLQNRVLAAFELGGLAILLTLRSLSACGMVYRTLLRAYGDHLYRNGGPMYVFRHLLAYMQKNRLELRPFLPLAWDLLSGWERIQPVKHRVPMPEPLFKAIFALGLLRGWVRWCARAGEPLRARRKDLLLPSDTLPGIEVGVFMAVRAPKTAFRGKGRIPHVCVKDRAFSIIFLELVFERVPAEDMLYRGSASSFRKRWDELLSLLSVPKALSLTPGGLRGAGAVKAYREGVTISDLRVRHSALWSHTYKKSRRCLSCPSSLQRVVVVSLLLVLSTSGFWTPFLPAAANALAAVLEWWRTLLPPLWPLAYRWKEALFSATFQLPQLGLTAFRSCCVRRARH